MSKVEKAYELPKWVGVVGAWIVQIWAFTQRHKVIDPDGLLKKAETEPTIFVLWHNRCAVFIPMVPRTLREHLYFLSSRSKDGAFTPAIFGRLGMKPVRGSTSRKGVDKGGAKALIELRRMLKKGECAAFTVDGPRGPKYSISPGVTWLAIRSGVPVVPVGYNSKWHFEINSWDNTHIPIPFSYGEVRIGQPVVAGRHDDEKEVEERIRQALLDITEWDHNPVES